MDKAKRAQTAETPKQPSLGLKLRAPYLYPDAAGKAANLVGERPMPSIARFGRLAYPMRGEVTNRAVLGRKRHGRPGIRSGWPAVGTTWVASKLGGLKIIE